MKGRHVIIYDDMTRSAGTLISAAEQYLKSGALSVSALLTHLALNNDKIVDKLEESPLVRIIATNSHPMSQCQKVKDSKKIVILDVTPVFGRTIRDHHMAE